MVWPTMKSMATKNTRQMLAILMAMRIQRCDVGRIARWRASVASCKATRCCHWGSAHSILPRRPPWSTILNETKNTNKTHLLPSFLTVDRRKKAKQFWDPTRTLYSSHWCNKLRINMKHYYLSWGAWLHFELSNIINGQKLEKLLALNKPKKKLWTIYGPMAVKLLNAALTL